MKHIVTIDTTDTQEQGLAAMLAEKQSVSPEATEDTVLVQILSTRLDGSGQSALVAAFLSLPSEDQVATAMQAKIIKPMPVTIGAPTKVIGG